ncbi:MAG TPA: molecular chaperone TorD family protein [Actinomycetota bacterium]
MSAPRADLLRALGALCEAPDPGHAALAEALGLDLPEDPAARTATFLFQVYPYASVHLGPEGMLGGEATDRVAGFWRAVGRTPPTEPDHLAALLGLAAALADAEVAEPEPARRALRREARAALLWEHLLSWVVPFLRATASAGTSFHAGWASLVEATLLEDARSLGAAPTRLSAHLRAAPPFPEDDAALDELLAATLAPVRSGVVLTRDDLTRAGRALGVGVRIGERRFILRAMLQQDPAGTLRWLAAEAARWAEIHAATRADLGPVAVFWEERARAAEARFLRLSTAAEEVMAGAAGR